MDYTVPHFIEKTPPVAAEGQRDALSSLDTLRSLLPNGPHQHLLSPTLYHLHCSPPFLVSPLLNLPHRWFLSSTFKKQIMRIV